jgi:hypothetical protein
MTPDRQPYPTARHEDAVDLGECGGRSTPNSTEAGHDVERTVRPGQCLHVTHPYVGVRVAVPGDRDQPWCCVDAGAHRAAQPGEFEREPCSTSDVEQAVTRVDTEPVMQRDVLAAVRRFTQGREVDGLASPALVDDRPVGRRGGGHCSPWKSSESAGLSIPVLSSRAEVAARLSPSRP